MYGVCQHLTYIIDQTCSEYDLKLIPCHKHAFHQVHVFNSLRVCLIVVFQHQPETGGTMSHA